MAELICISPHTGREIRVPAKTVLCLGNFDGVHLGHQAILQSAVSWRDRGHSDVTVGAFCFREPPSRYLGGRPAEQLCLPEERLQRLAEQGAEVVLLADFPSLRELSPETFAEEILKKKCHAVAVACGFNHRFGCGGAGDPSILKKTFGEDSLLLTSAVTHEGRPVSSSRIREAIREKRMEEAAVLLGRPFTLMAPVLHGKALGRTLGAPTVNQKFPAGHLVPPKGVYLTETRINGRTWRGVSNVGTRPTVDGDTFVNCETHLLGFEGDLYGQALTVSFLRYLREERKFETLEELRAQIAEDVRAAAEEP